MNTPFQPDYRHIVDAVRNRRPRRLPLYEHIVSPQIMETILGVAFAGHERAPGEDARPFFERVKELGTRFRNAARGYALGSGNSIPKYVPADGYLAMVRAAQAIRKGESA